MSDEAREENEYLSAIDRKVFFAMCEQKVPSCGTCKFWTCFEPPTWRWPGSDGEILDEGKIYRYAQWDGECQRYPPAFSSVDEPDYRFPTTNHDTWCGEYKPAD